MSRCGSEHAKGEHQAGRGDGWPRPDVPSDLVRPGEKRDQQNGVNDGMTGTDRGRLQKITTLLEVIAIHRFGQANLAAAELGVAVRTIREHVKHHIGPWIGRDGYRIKITEAEAGRAATEIRELLAPFLALKVADLAIPPAAEPVSEPQPEPTFADQSEQLLGFLASVGSQFPHLSRLDRETARLCDHFRAWSQSVEQELHSE